VVIIAAAAANSGYAVIYRGGVCCPLIFERSIIKMACKNVCKLCPNLIISQAVTFTAGTGLIINLPAGNYNDDQKYCIVVAQSIPAATTITAPVFVTIGAGTEQYPLIDSCCAQVTACAIRTRTRYATIVKTNATGGSFKLLNKTCALTNSLASINGGAE
jgi:hypothetical protein